MDSARSLLDFNYFRKADRPPDSINPQPPTDLVHIPTKNQYPPDIVHWVVTLKMGRAVIANAFVVEHHQAGSLQTLSSWRTSICTSPISDRG